METDSLHRFVFERTQVRGEWVHLDATWRALLERHDYPAPVRQLLGEALAAVVLLSATIKNDGVLTLQISGSGPVSLLVVQVTGARTARGLVAWDGDVPKENLSEQFGNGHLVMTIDPGAGKERYQGIVGLEADSIADALADYFSQSEQLPTRLWLSVNDSAVAGLLLQRLPGEEHDEDAWGRCVMLANTLKDEELLSLEATETLTRLFHEEEVRLFEREPVSFRCSCSRERVANMIVGLGVDEARSIIQDEGGIHVQCEYCNASYDFDTVDVEALFANGETMPQSPSTH